MVNLTSRISISSSRIQIRSSLITTMVRRRGVKADDKLAVQCLTSMTSSTVLLLVILEVVLTECLEGLRTCRTCLIGIQIILEASGMVIITKICTADISNTVIPLTMDIGGVTRVKHHVL